MLLAEVQAVRKTVLYCVAVGYGLFRGGCNRGVSADSVSVQINGILRK